MVGRTWAAWGLVAGLGLGCGGADHQRGATGGAPGQAGAPGNATGGAPVATGGAAGTTGGGAAGTSGGAAGTTGGGAAGAGMTMSPSTFISPGANFTPGGICDADGWCWYDPRPSGDVWQAIAGAGTSEIWIGGASNTLLHLAPGGWSAVTSPLSVTEGIWAAAANDVWFVGTSQPEIAAIAHWDGHAVTLTAEFGSGELNDIWGSGPSDVYAVGFNTVQHWDGQTWSTVAGVTGTLVSGSSSSDVWAGSIGLEHFDGTIWTSVAQFSGAFMLGVADAAPNDVWAVALQGGVESVEHFDGTAWTTSFQTTSSNISLQNIVIGAGGSTDVWLSGSEFDGVNTHDYLAHFDGAGWTQAPQTAPPLHRANGTRGFGDLAVGDGGAILTLTSNPTVGFTATEVGPLQTLTGVWGSSPTDMWAVGGAGTVLHFDGTTVATVPTITSVDLTDVWGTGPEDVWIVGRAGTALHFDGHALSSVSTGITADLLAVFTATPGDVWIGGDSTLAHLQGGTSGTFAPVAVPGLAAPFGVDDLHGLGAGDIWLAGGHDASGIGPAGFVAHFDGTAWSAADVLTATAGGDNITRVWALGPNDVWALTHPLFGDIVGFWHFDGTTWTDVSAASSPATFMFPDPAVTLESFVFGPHDRWIVGTFGAWERNTQ